MQVVASGATDRKSLARGLTKVLDDTHSLYAKTWRFHRDAGGPGSIVLRLLLAQQCRELGRGTDRIVQRIRSLGLPAQGWSPSLRKAPVHQGPVWSAKDMIGCLVERHESVARRIESVLRLSEKAADRATCELLRQRIKAHEKAAWVLAKVGIIALVGEFFDRARLPFDPEPSTNPAPPSYEPQALRSRENCPISGPHPGAEEDEREGTRMARTLVVYYSRTGVTKKAATAIAEALGADVEELTERKSRAGILGYVRSVVDAGSGKLTELEPLRHLPEDYDLVVFGSPVWAASLSAPVRTYLLRNYDDLEEVAFFCTCGSRGGERVLRQMADLCRNEPATTLILRETEVLRGSFHRKVSHFADDIVKALGD